MLSHLNTHQREHMEAVTKRSSGQWRMHVPTFSLSAGQQYVPILLTRISRGDIVISLAADRAPQIGCLVKLARPFGPRRLNSHRPLLITGTARVVERMDDSRLRIQIATGSIIDVSYAHISSDNS
jgi:hypothetical protein